MAKQVSTEIADVVANSPVPGEVKIYVLMEGGALAGEEMKSKVLAACSEDTKRPLTDHVFVEDAEVVSYDISFTYYLQSGRTKSAAEVATTTRTSLGNISTTPASSGSNWPPPPLPHCGTAGTGRYRRWRGPELSPL